MGRRLDNSDRGVLGTADSWRRVQKTINRVDNDRRNVRPPKIRTAFGDDGLVVRLAKPKETITRNGSGIVILHGQLGPETSGECGELVFLPAGVEVCAQNLIGDVSVDQWVYVAEIEQTWHIIARADQHSDACGRVETDLIKVKFEACHGKDASATVHVEGNCPGPIASITLDSGGEGYAVKARTQPTLTVTSVSSEGITVTPVVDADEGECGETTYSISSATASGDGFFIDGEDLLVEFEEGTVVEVQPVLRLGGTRSEPQIGAAVCCGSVANLEVVIESNGTTPPTWGVATVIVNNGGSGFSDLAPVEFQYQTPGNPNGRMSVPAKGRIFTGREAPTITATPRGTSGSGAVLNVDLEQYLQENLRYEWRIDTISVTTPGTGYTSGTQVAIKCVSGVQLAKAFASVVEVDDEGGIVEVYVPVQGAFYRDTGSIDKVEIIEFGEYYNYSPTDVTVENGGKFYLVDNDSAVHVADVTVTLEQAAPSAGTGAEFTAVVDDDPESASFGQITSVTITEAGDNYVETGYDYPLTWNGLKFSDLPGYDGSKVQMLGHEAGGCLSWFNVTTCEEDTSGVCCVDGEPDAEITTSADCSTAGGTWKPGAAADDLPGPCCE